MAAVALRHDALVWFFCFCFPRVVRAASAIISRAGLLHSLFVLFFHHFSFSFFFFLVYRAPLYFCYDFGFFFQNIFCCLRWPPPRWAPRGSFRLLVDFGFLWSRTRDRYGIWKFGRPRGAWIGCLEMSSFKEKRGSSPILLRCYQLKWLPIGFRRRFYRRERISIRHIDHNRPDPKLNHDLLIELLFHGILLHSAGFYLVLLGFTGFFWVLLGSTGFYWVLLGSTGFYWVLLGFYWFGGF